MADYQEMYLTLMRATEQAIRTLIDAQQKCEEMFLDAEDTPLTLLPEKSEPEE